MNELKVFTYQETQVRTIQKDGEPWFVLKDVCQVLDLGSPHKVADRLDEDERNQIPLTDGLGRQQETTIISESGLYTVILRSDKPEAKPFRRWVTHEVLPAIRRTGTYGGLDGKSAAPLPPESAGGVAKLLSVLRATMRDNEQPPEVISQMVKDLCGQFGIRLPDDFVRRDPFQQLAIVGVFGWK